MNKVVASAPGKSILFGEHSVVYGHGAVAMAISACSTCSIEEEKDKKIHLHLNNSEKFEFSGVEAMVKNLPGEYRQISHCFHLIHQNYNLDPNNIRISITSQLFKSSGLGSSASTAVALVQALSTYYDLDLQKEEISNMAYEMEKVIHGTPSGIDNTICTFGYMIYYQNKKFEPLMPPSGLKLLISFTNVAHDTKKAIEKVKSFKSRNPEQCEKIFQEMGVVAMQGKEALKAGDLKMIGHLMDINQGLLSQLGVSNEKIDFIVKIANKNGAYGSKLTGAGLGGCVISLADDATLQKVSRILKEEGFKNFIAEIDKNGVGIEKKE